MNIDATLLSICSFCNIWYRSLSNFYSATAKTQWCKMGFSGQVYMEKVFATFSDFYFEIWNFLSGLTFWLIKHTLMQDSFAPQKALSGPLKYFFWANISNLNICCALNSLKSAGWKHSKSLQKTFALKDSGISFSENGKHSYWRIL